MGSYGVAADCWSLGAVIFVMLSGVFPEFSGEGSNRQISFARPEYWGHISAHCKDLISRLMHPNPNKRISMEDASAHPWLSDLMGKATAKPEPNQEAHDDAHDDKDQDEDTAMRPADPDKEPSEIVEVSGMPPTNEMAKIQISSPSGKTSGKGVRGRQGGREGAGVIALFQGLRVERKT